MKSVYNHYEAILQQNNQKLPQELSEGMVLLHKLRLNQQSQKIKTSVKRTDLTLNQDQEPGNDDLGGKYNHARTLFLLTLKNSVEESTPNPLRTFLEDCYSQDASRPGAGAGRDAADADSHDDLFSGGGGGGGGGSCFGASSRAADTCGACAGSSSGGPAAEAGRAAAMSAGAADEGLSPWEMLWLDIHAAQDNAGENNKQIMQQLPQLYALKLSHLEKMYQQCLETTDRTDDNVIFFRQRFESIEKINQHIIAFYDQTKFHDERIQALRDINPALIEENALLREKRITLTATNPEDPVVKEIENDLKENQRWIFFNNLFAAIFTADPTLFTSGFDEIEKTTNVAAAQKFLDQSSFAATAFHRNKFFNWTIGNRWTSEIYADPELPNKLTARQIKAQKQLDELSPPAAVDG